MATSPQWHPVASSQALRAGENTRATLLLAQPLALWRSASGQVQAWEDRCPHRGVALSLGRIQGDRLACAYHGWQYAAQDGRCVAIPAMPQQPVPGKVCVRTYGALERQGMVWVNLAGDRARDAAPAAEPADHVFLRALGVDTAIDRVDVALAASGFVQQAPHVWLGTLVGWPMRLYTQTASAQWSMLHLFCAPTPDPARQQQLLASANMLRAAIEATPGY